MTSTAEDSETRRKVRLMTAEGVPVRQIALALNISTQAVYKHLRKMKAQEGEGNVATPAS